MSAIQDWLTAYYPWIKAFHVISVIAWMAGMFYLPRLFVYHVERGVPGSELDKTFKIMERRLLKAIINPAGIATWTFGLMLVFTPGVVDWRHDQWAWVKAIMVFAMTYYYHLLVIWRRQFAEDRNQHSGRYYRIANEVPTLLLIVIVLMVIARPF